MFAKALFPTDFTAHSTAVLDCLAELKAAGLQHVVLLNVIRHSEVPLAHSAINEESLANVQWGRKEHLHLARLALEGQGLAARTRVEYGSPAREIVRVAQEERVDLIVLGTEGGGVMQELVYGGTAFDVLRMSPVPVLVQKFDVVRALGHAECRPQCAHIFSRVLHPTDFSEYASTAFNVVKRLKAAGTEEVFIVHVAEERVLKEQSPERVAESVHENIERLERMRRDLTLYGLPAKTMLRHGDPVHEVLRIADEEKVSVIVLGLSGESSWQELFSGGTFEKVVRQSRHPVLVVRHTGANGSV